MRKLKQASVVFFGFFMIVSVGLYQVHRKNLKNPSSAFDRQWQHPDIPDKFENLELKPESPSILPQAHPTGDHIDWQKKQTELPKNARSKISGKIPFQKNPNSVFIDASNRILPAVVSIHTQKRKKALEEGIIPPLFSPNESPNDFFPPGTGSGILISDDGYILTNYHVIEGADKLQVLLYDKREYQAQIIGGEPSTDIAVIKISGKDLPAALVGDSENVQIGEWVLAVGNPLNFTSTVTTGIVSALGRNLNIIDSRYSYRIENFIQTDAVINPGNSGGALVNLGGEVIGINTAIATRNGYYQGYGFAIPINLAKRVVDDILVFGYFRRAILGVAIAPVTDRVAKLAGLEKPKGAMISSIIAKPAQIAGLQSDDIILEVDEKPIHSVNHLQLAIAQYSPGKTVTLKIWRAKKAQNILIKLGEAPRQNGLSFNEPKKDPFSVEKLGINFEILSAKKQAEFHTKSALKITSITPKSPAGIANIPDDSFLLAVDETPIMALAELAFVIKDSQIGDFIKLKIRSSNALDDQEAKIYFVEIR